MAGAGKDTWDPVTLKFSDSRLDLVYSYDAAGNITQIVNSQTPVETQGYTYDSLNRLLTAAATTGPAQYTESYTYDATTGNLASKAGVNYSYQPAHPHAVTSAGGAYTYDANGNMVTRPVNAVTYTLSYDAEGHMVTVSSGSYSAAFTYDGDGKRVKSTINSVSTIFVGNYYEKTGSTITKYYYAGATRIGMRKYTIPQSMVVEYFLGDHLGSTSITTDTAGAKVSEMRYKPFGEVRYTWKDPTLTQTTPAYGLTRWTFTGQYSYADDPSTPGAEDFGLLYFNARFYDPTLGRFSSADSLIPGAGDSQAWDRYAYGLNNPSRYTDPTGHWVAETNRPEDELRRNSYVHAAIRISGRDAFSAHLKEYYIYAAAYYQARISEAHQETIEIGATFLKSRADNVRRNGWNGKTDAGSAVGDIVLANAPDMLGPATIGLAGIFINWKGNPIEISPHALEQIELRGVPVNEVERIMNAKGSFFYWDEGILKQGWYDKGQKVLIAMAVDDQVLTTVVTGVDPQYIADLRSRKP